MEGRCCVFFVSEMSSTISYGYFKISMILKLGTRIIPGSWSRLPLSTCIIFLKKPNIKRVLCMKGFSSRPCYLIKLSQDKVQHDVTCTQVMATHKHQVN